jgi:hypothetical protein
MAEGDDLVGYYRVRGTSPAFKTARRLFPRTKDRMILRRHSLKLAWWPRGGDGSVVADLDWEWVKALPGKKIGELRIGEEIGGHDNLRVYFYVGDEAVRDPLPMIWVLHVIQKKSNDIKPGVLDTLRLQRQLVIDRFYPT